MSESGSSQERRTLRDVFTRRFRKPVPSNNNLATSTPEPKIELETVDIKKALARAAFIKLLTPGTATTRHGYEPGITDERFIVLDSPDQTTKVAIALRQNNWATLNQKARPADLLRISFWKDNGEHGRVDYKNFDGRYAPQPPDAEFESSFALNWRNEGEYPEEPSWMKSSGVFQGVFDPTPLTDIQLQALTEIINSGSANFELTDKAVAYLTQPGINSKLVIEGQGESVNEPLQIQPST